MSNDADVPQIQRRGLMLVLSSPSGAGKTTLSRQLLENDPHIRLSVSCTKRGMISDIEGSPREPIRISSRPMDLFQNGPRLSI